MAIAISTRTVEEKSAGTIATLSGAASYRIEGGADVLAAFEIVDGNLIVKDGVILDYETRKTFDFQIKGLDAEGNEIGTLDLTGDNAFTITNVNEAPTDIVVAGGSIADNAILGTTIAILTNNDPDKGDLFTYTIVKDANGSEVRDHPYFEISGNEIVVKSDLATAPESSSIYVKVTDAKGLSYVEQVTLTIAHVNERPDVSFDAKEVLEGAQGGTIVGTLKATDLENDPVTYTLSAVSADWFTLVKNADGSYNVVVKQGVTLDLDHVDHQNVTLTISDGSNIFDDTFSLNLIENLEPEANFQFNTIARNAGAGTIVGTLVADDPEGRAVGFTLSDESAALFYLVKNPDGSCNVVVKDGITLDYENADHHVVNVTVSDGFNTFDESFELDFLNAAPEAFFEAVTVDEGLLGGMVVGTLFVSDPEDDPVTCTLSADSAKLFELAYVDAGIYDVVVRNGVTLDYETLAHHTFKMTLSDGTNSVSETFEIDLADVNEKPTVTFTPAKAVSEGAGGGTVVGKLTATDPEGDIVSYTLTSGSEKWFDLVENEDGSCDIVVKEGVALDYEALAHHSVTVLASDGENTVSKSAAINLLDGVDVLIGTKGKDVLTGTAGPDIIKGLAGNDRLTGGAGQDVFVFDTKPNKKTNLDKIADFSVPDDSIWLENKIFAKLGKKGSEAAPAQLNKKFFALEKAKDKDDYLIYSKKTGKLYYDADGSGAKAAVEIATLSKKLALTYKDFFVI